VRFTSLLCDRKNMVHDSNAVLLVGGMGTRLRSVVPSSPKPLALVRGRPFLELLVRQLRHQGIRRLVMCTGHLAEQIENEFANGHNLDVEIEYSKEPHPLGTGGAVKLAERYLQNTDDFLVMNGDSFLELDFHQLIHFHRQKGGLVSMAVMRVQDTHRYGTVQVDADNRVIGFAEKTASDTPGLVNAGVYVFNRAVLDYIPEGPASLERDVFPRLLDHGMYAAKQYGMFIDIGTPEDYARAQAVCDRFLVGPTDGDSV
jgi:D-glycero-alpha-D-manno-heptose 1-phosphate guanylyltransferase